MSLTLLPAVDVADGRVVGTDPYSTGSYSTDPRGTDPREAALAFEAAGAEWIHLVDMDAAFGRGSNAPLLASVVGALDVKVELAGGIVDAASLDQALSTGCDRVSLGTAALRDRAWCSNVIATLGDRVAVSLDVRIGEVPDGSASHVLAARGSSHIGDELWETLAGLDEAGCARYIVTDVSRDGMLSGPNVELYRAVTAATSAPVIASGGIANIGDLQALAAVVRTGANLEGAIVGSALHAGRFTLSDALYAVRTSDRGS